MIVIFSDMACRLLINYWRFCRVFLRQVFFGLFTCGFSMDLLGTHDMPVPMLLDQDFIAFTCSMGIGLIGFFAVGGTLILGCMADYLPRRYVMATLYVMRGLAFFALVMAGRLWEIYLTSSVGGLVWTGSTALACAILADFYGARLVAHVLWHGMRLP